MEASARQSFRGLRSCGRHRALVAVGDAVFLRRQARAPRAWSPSEQTDLRAEHSAPCRDLATLGGGSGCHKDQRQLADREARGLTPDFKALAARSVPTSALPPTR